MNIRALTPATMSFRATATPIGNSKGLRLDAALFKAHPEFASGEFEVDVIAPGRLLVRAEPALAGVADDVDPVFDAFLGFLGQAMEAHPQWLTPFRASEIRHVRELVAGVEVDPDEDFSDFELP